jgi:ABC-type multidrug transport system fused ATPase/permease subunit
LSPLLRIGAKRPLTVDDVWDVPQAYRVKRIVEVVVPAWEQEVTRAHGKGQEPKLMRALLPLVWKDLLRLLCLMFSMMSMLSAGPLLMKNFLLNLEDPESDLKRDAVPYVVGFAGTFYVVSHIVPHLRFTSAKIGTIMRVAVQELVFRASLDMSLEVKQVNTASVVNLMSVDAERFFTVTTSMMVIQAVPSIFLQSAILVYTMGWLSLVGVMFMILAIPITGKIGKRLGRYRGQMSQHMEQRVSATKNFITGIRIVKASGWIDAAHRQVAAHRKNEVRALRQVLICRALNLCIAFVATPISALVMFTLFVKTGGEMSADKVFTALAVLRTLQMPLMMLPMFVTNIFEFQVAKQRVERFLRLMTTKGFQRQVSENTQNAVSGQIQIQDGHFAWNPDVKEKMSSILKKGKGKGKGKGKDVEKEEVSDNASKDKSPESEQKRVTELSNVNLSINKGELVVVLGPTGSGKTSLLMAMLGEMGKKSGVVNVNGQVALAGQEPWIRSCTVQENVLFRRDFDFERYDSVMNASVLSADLQALPNGDKTEIGERGINLSGGQKARIALARALYRLEESDIYMIDDVLSAVDAHVGQAIVEEALLGMLATKTRIIVLNTFLPSVLPHADRVIVMNSGRIEAQGSVQECLESSMWLRSIYDEQSGVNAGQAELAKKRAVAAKTKASDAKSVGLTSIEDEKQVIWVIADGELYKEEERATGVLEFGVYKRFFAELSPQRPWMGSVIFFGLVGVVALAEACRVGHDVVIMRWVQVPEEGDDFWISILGGCVGGVLLFGVSRATIFMEVCARISRRTHDRMLFSVFSGSVPLYFDVTPVGRILNRFSKDLDSLDMQLPMFMFEFLQAFVYIMGVLAVCAYTSWATLILLIPMFFIFYRVRKYFSCTSRELKRIESVSRSPVFSLFGETVGGLPHLRAFKMVGQQAEAFDECCNSNFKIFFHLYSLTSWLIYRLDLLGATMILSIGLSCLWVPRTTQTAAILGLGLTTANGLMGRLHMTVQMSIETENHMTSVERLQHFATIPKEDSLAAPAEPLEAAWPAQGNIKFDNILMRYRPQLPLVLNKLSFEVPAGHRAGIVGRTGCGKSSLMQALLRIVELEGGCITIDGVDLSKIPLARLRGEAVSLIPQEPYLFGGSVLDNLDPFHIHSEDTLWNSLKLTYMDEVVRSMGGLSATLVEGGDNLSAGQRQLLCIARVMLRKSRVVLMDEATASIDMATDILIQKSIAEAFKGCTVLAIAHRLDTIMDSDVVIVLEAGRVVEQGPPQELLRADGPFASLAKSLGRDGASEAGSNDESTTTASSTLVKI